MRAQEVFNQIRWFLKRQCCKIFSFEYPFLLMWLLIISQPWSALFLVSPHSSVTDLWELQNYRRRLPIYCPDLIRNRKKCRDQIPRAHLYTNHPVCSVVIGTGRFPKDKYLFK